MSDQVTSSGCTEFSLLRTMLRIRAFEEEIVRAFRRGEIPGFVHVSIGSEAVAAGVCSTLHHDDFVVSTHRGHGHCLAKGSSPNAMMSEIYGKANGSCSGRGGSMHLADASVGVIGANGIVGGGLAMATGAALSCKLRGTQQVAVAFFGDGAANEGDFHESLNLAAIWDLPVIYVCENNGFADSTPASYAMRVPNVAVRAAAYDIAAITIDGQDAPAVVDAMTEALVRARSGLGPTLLEAATYRLHGHYEGDPDRARDDSHREQVRANDPVERLAHTLLLRDPDIIEWIERARSEAQSEMEDAVQWARDAPFPDPLRAGDYTHPEPA